MAKYSVEEVMSARKRLEHYLTPNRTVFAIHRHVSRSGLTRYLDFYVMDCENERMVWLTWSIAVLLGERFNEKRDGIAVRGYGFNAEQDVVDTLSRAFNVPLNYDRI